VCDPRFPKNLIKLINFILFYVIFWRFYSQLIRKVDASKNFRPFDMFCVVNLNILSCLRGILFGRRYLFLISESTIQPHLSVFVIHADQRVLHRHCWFWLISCLIHHSSSCHRGWIVFTSRLISFRSRSIWSYALNHCWPFFAKFRCNCSVMNTWLFCISCWCWGRERKLLKIVNRIHRILRGVNLFNQRDKLICVVWCIMFLIDNCRLVPFLWVSLSWSRGFYSWWRYNLTRFNVSSWIAACRWDIVIIFSPVGLLIYWADVLSMLIRRFSSSFWRN